MLHCSSAEEDFQVKHKLEDNCHPPGLKEEPERDLYTTAEEGEGTAALHLHVNVMQQGRAQCKLHSSASPLPVHFSHTQPAVIPTTTALHCHG